MRAYSQIVSGPTRRPTRPNATRMLPERPVERIGRVAVIRRDLMRVGPQRGVDLRMAQTRGHGGKVDAGMDEQ